MNGIIKDSWLNKYQLEKATHITQLLIKVNFIDIKLWYNN